MSADAMFVLAVLGLNLAVSEWLVRHTFCRHLGTAMLVIVVTAITANAGLIPTGTDPPPLYDGIFSAVAPLSIFLLLLGVSLADLRRAGAAMVALFLLGAVGTMSGVLVGMGVIDGEAVFGEHQASLGGMFVGTYTGGSLNFNLLALHFGVAEEGVLYTGAVAVDAIMTAVWMVVTIALPRGLAALSQRGKVAAIDAVQKGPREVLTGIEQDTETAHPLDLALLLMLAAGSLWISRRAADWLSQPGVLSAEGVKFPSVLILTTLALFFAQVPALRRLPGARLLGMFGVYLFLAVIGAYCDLGSLAALGSLGPTLFLFVTVILLVHGAIIFGGAAVFRLDRDMAAVASQANIGGGTTALALARSLGRGDLVLPGILVGSLGTALGTYLGLAAAAWFF